MNNYNQVDELEAERLKQILFPRKAKPVRSLVASSIEQVKENKQANTYALHTNRHRSLREQIGRLKQGIQLFLDKHSLNQNYLTTPRECLELIKYMSEGMINYSDEIEEAVVTLIESIPKPLAKVMPMSKYFIMGFKFSYLNSLYLTMRRRTLSSSFMDIKQESSQHKEQQAREEEQARDQSRKLEILILNKLSKGFNRWRINVQLENKSTIEKYYIENNAQISSMLHNFANQSQLVLYLQKLLHSETNADAIQILLYNSKANLLRGYQPQCDNMGSVFESVRGNFCLSQRAAYENEGLDTHRPGAKAIEMRLDHSLTKICIVKRQLITVQQMTRDRDYLSSVDDYTIFYGLSARNNLASCIFTPLIGKSGCIGVIRQYFHNKVGDRPNVQTVSMISLVLENCIKTSHKFEQVKQKSTRIRNLCYLKAILVSNTLQKQEPDDLIEQTFYSLLHKYFNIKYKADYSYTVEYNLDKIPHVTVSSSRHEQDVIPEIVVAIRKMIQLQTYYLYDHDRLYFMMESKIAVFQMVRNKEVDTKQIGELVPVPIIMQLLDKKEQVRNRKLKEFEEYQREQERLQREQKERKATKKKNSILQFCMEQKDVKNQQELIEIVKQFLNNLSDEKCNELQVRVEHKNRNQVKNCRTSEDTITLYEDSKRKIYLNGKLTKNQQNQINQYLMTPLKDLCSSMVGKITKPSPISDFSHICMKAQIHYNSQNIELGLVELIKQVMGLSEQEIKAIPSTSNPFTAEDYYCFIQKSDLVLQPTATFLKCVKNSSFQPLHSLNPICTILYLRNSIFIVIDKYVGITEEHITKLKAVYQNWKNQKKQHERNLAIKKKQASFFRGFMKIDKVAMQNLRKIFYAIKNNTIKIKDLPNFLQSYIYREDKKALNYAFSLIRGQKRRETSQFSHLHTKILKLNQTIYKMSGISPIFKAYGDLKRKNKILSQLWSILVCYQNTSVSIAFDRIYTRKHFVNTNRLSILVQIFDKIMAPAFEIVKRHSKAKESLGIIQTETQCSIISKMDSLLKIFKLVQQKFDSFQFFLCLKRGVYLQLSANRFEITDEFRDRAGFQYFQFICQSKSQIRHVVWLVPQTYTVSLIEKHYLQVLSRAVEEGFAKFIYKNEQFLSTILLFVEAKTKSLVQAAAKRLRAFAMSKIKAEEYSLRDRYYEASIEVDNFKLMEKEQAKEEEQRMKQICQSMKAKQKYEQELSQNRKSIVRLEVSSKKLEQLQVKQRLEIRRQEIMIAFNTWRVEAAHRSRYAQRRLLARKKQGFSCTALYKFLNQIVQENYKYCLQRIIIESANNRARDLSSKKQSLKENSQFHQNRLLTFQDELNELTERDGEDLSKKEISIIPISFKHFEGSKKQNYDVTDDDLKKVNGGAYKLNAKTLKFLKRMGKLNN